MFPEMALGSEHSCHGNHLSRILGGCDRRSLGDERSVLALNVLLLGDRQSGRSSVGNALIGQ